MVVMASSGGGGGLASQLQLPPGFRFHPTDEELVLHYLWRKAESHMFAIPVIAEIDLYKFDPWELPGKAIFGEREWYFFSPRDRKYPNGARPNRAAASGYWKATGTDKPIHTAVGAGAGGGVRKVGVKKALVFYKGRAPKGVKTNWIMHEYRLADGVCAAAHAHRKGSLRLDDWVLCRIYKKSSSAPRSGKERENSSSVEEVLASLPEIDDPKLMLPRLGSFTGFPEPEPHFVDSLLTGERISERGSRAAADVESFPESKRSILQSSKVTDLGLQRGLGHGQQQQHHPHPETSSTHNQFGKLPASWTLETAHGQGGQQQHHHHHPFDGQGQPAADKFNRRVLDLGSPSQQRPTALTLRPASDLPARHVDDLLLPTRPSKRAHFAELAKSDEEVQSSRRTSPMGQHSASGSHNEGLESIFAFNYDQPRSTINALLPVSTSAGSPNTDLGFSGGLRGA